MKKASFLVVLGGVLCALIIWLGGCGYFAQPGETTAEGHRRHLHNLSVNQQQLIQDLDSIMLSDKPSKLSDKRLP